MESKKRFSALVTRFCVCAAALLLAGQSAPAAGSTESAEPSAREAALWLPSSYERSAAQPPAAGPVDPLDKSALFEKLMAGGDSVLSAADVLDLRLHYKILMAQGFLSNFHSGPNKPGRSGPFEDQMDEFDALGVDYVKADINPEGSSDANAAVIAGLIEGSEKKTILITHSKGGNDALHALIQRPELRAKIAGWFSIQTPFFGSPIAQVMLHDKTTTEMFRIFLHSLGGSNASLLDLETDFCTQYYQDHKDAIGVLQRSFPIISLGGWYDERQTGRLLAFPLSIFNVVLEDHYGERNDGMAPLSSEILPGAPYIVVPRLDHNGAVTSDRAAPFNRRQFALVMLSMILHPESE